MSYKLLVLEDDPFLRETLVDCLTEQGYEVVAVERGQDAVDQASQQAFDLLISDIRMEGLNGLDAIEQAKGLQPSLTSMVVSGYCSEAETLRAIQLNVSAYLRKPFVIQDFLQQVRKLLAQRAEQQQRSEQRDELTSLLHWALDALVLVADQSELVAPNGTLAQAGRLGQALAGAAGLAGPVCERVGRAAQLSLLLEHPQIRLPESAALLPLTSLLEKSPELAPRIAEFSRVKALTPDSATDDRELQELYERATPHLQMPLPSQEILRGLADPQKLLSSLLGLGQTLEQSGDLESAQKAFQEVSQRAPHSWESVLAQLGLARLGGRRGQLGPVETHAVAAFQQAQNLGPLAAARACLESGLLLARWGAPRAQSALERAAELLGTLGLTALEAKARLALLRFQPAPAAGASGHVKVLLEPRHAAELADTLELLLPVLLDHGASQPELLPGLTRLLADHDQEIARSLATQAYPVATRQALLAALTGSTYAAPPQTSAALARDADPEVRQQAQALLSRQGSAPTPLLRFHSLGFFQCFCGSRRLQENEFHSQKGKYLLAMLAAHPGRPLSDDQLVDEFWPDAGLRGIKNLNSALFHLRQCFKAETPFEYVLRTKTSVELNPEAPRWHDFEELELALQAGARQHEAGQVQDAIRAYRRALGLYSGPYLEGCFLEWALRRRSGLEEKVGSAMARLAQLCFQTRSYAEALEAASKALEIDPSNQEAHVAKMRSHVGSGSPEAAIRHFEKVERSLRQEYDLEPSLEMVEVYQRARYGMPVD